MGGLHHCVTDLETTFGQCRSATGATSMFVEPGISSSRYSSAWNAPVTVISMPVDQTLRRRTTIRARRRWRFAGRPGRHCGARAIFLFQARPGLPGDASFEEQARRWHLERFRVGCRERPFSSFTARWRSSLVCSRRGARQFSRRTPRQGRVEDRRIRAHHLVEQGAPRDTAEIGCPLRRIGALVQDIAATDQDRRLHGMQFSVRRQGVAPDMAGIFRVGRPNAGGPVEPPCGAGGQPGATHRR